MLKPTLSSAETSPMPMRLALALLAALTVLAAAPAGAGGALTVGVTDDSGLGSADGGTSFVATLRDLGFAENRVTVLWDPDAPATIPNEAALDAYLAAASANSVRVVLAVYPARSTALTASANAVWQFTAFLEQLARRYPQVTDVVVGNEPNQPRFWRPQFDAAGHRVGCAAYAGVLAAAYDALKAVNPAITVVGLGLSPRGNDNAQARDNASTSPVRCLRDIGAAYRASKRAKPIMDELSFHAHPENDTQPFGARAAWPKAGLSDLDRIKQAVWDAFNGTAQPTFAEAGRSVVLPTLKLRIAEVGWQVGIVPSAQGSYTGTENVPTTDEAAQAANYVESVRALACDDSVRSLLFFGLVDEPDLARWQAGLVRADGTARPAYSRGQGRARRQRRLLRRRSNEVEPHHRRLWRDSQVPVAHGGAEELPRLGLHRGRQGGLDVCRRPLPAAAGAVRQAVALRHQQLARRAEAVRDPAGLPPVRTRQGAVRALGHLPQAEAEAGVLRLRPSPRGRDEPRPHDVRDEQGLPPRPARPHGQADAEAEAQDQALSRTPT